MTYPVPSIRIYNSSVLHKYGFAAADPRVAWTRCGIRFAWGRVPGQRLRLSACEACQP